MAATGLYATEAAMLMLFVQKLSKMIADQGMPELFLDYCEEHVEMHKGQGLASKENPINQAILTETVLAEKSKAQAYDEKMDKMMTTIESANAAIDQKVRGRMDEVNSLISKVAALKKALGEKDDRKTGGLPTHRPATPAPTAAPPTTLCGTARSGRGQTHARRRSGRKRPRRRGRLRPHRTRRAVASRRRAWGHSSPRRR